MLTSCAIGYSCQSTAWPRRRSSASEACARAGSTTPSPVPWAMKIGVAALAGLRCASVVSSSGR